MAPKMVRRTLRAKGPTLPWCGPPRRAVAAPLARARVTRRLDAALLRAHVPRLIRCRSMHVVALRTAAKGSQRNRSPGAVSASTGSTTRRTGCVRGSRGVTGGAPAGTGSRRVDLVRVVATGSGGASSPADSSHRSHSTGAHSRSKVASSSPRSTSATCASRSGARASCEAMDGVAGGVVARVATRARRAAGEVTGAPRRQGGRIATAGRRAPSRPCARRSARSRGSSRRDAG